MAFSAAENPPDEQLLTRAAAGNQEGWAAPPARHCEPLRTMIALRIDRRLQGLPGGP
jgi:hypothetical protein